jgi:hypothetical protein
VIRLHVVAEGRTEQLFARQVLAPHLRGCGVEIGAVHNLKGDPFWVRNIAPAIKATFGRDTKAWVTTLVDFYGLGKDVPGLQEAWALPGKPSAKVLHLQERVAQAVGNYRFLPFFTLHEIEAWLFCGPDVVGKGRREGAALAAEMRAIASAAGGPEGINGGRDTHPKSRLMDLLQQRGGYSETGDGVGWLGAIGLAKIRAQCPHMSAWVARLEGLASDMAPEA